MTPVEQLPIGQSLFIAVMGDEVYIKWVIHLLLTGAIINK